MVMTSKKRGGCPKTALPMHKFSGTACSSQPFPSRKYEASRYAMTFNLTYRKGSFPQSEVYSSLLGALDRAHVVLETGSCFGLEIDEDGMHLLYESEIISELGKLPSVSQVVRPPLLPR